VPLSVIEKQLSQFRAPERIKLPEYVDIIGHVRECFPDPILACPHVDNLLSIRTESFIVLDPPSPDKFQSPALHKPHHRISLVWVLVHVCLQIASLSPNESFSIVYSELCHYIVQDVTHLRVVVMFQSLYPPWIGVRMRHEDQVYCLVLHHLWLGLGLCRC